MTGGAKAAQGQGGFWVFLIIEHLEKVLERRLAIFPGGTQRTGLHLFEAKCQGTLNGTTGDCLSRQEYGSGTRRAVVVDVDHRNAGHKRIIKRMLSAGGVTVDIAAIGLFYQLRTNSGFRYRGLDRS